MKKSFINKGLNILILTTPFNAKGGVSEYHNALVDQSKFDINYFFVGSRSNNNRFALPIIRLLRDYVNFYRIITKYRFDLIHINPSLGLKSILRDAIFLLLAKNCTRSKVLIMWHGWDENCYIFITKNRIVKKIFKDVYNRADAFTVLASEFKDQLAYLNIVKPVYIERTLFKESLTTNFNFNESFSKSDKLNILYLSRIEKSKGIYEAIDTYRILKKTHPHINMTISGDGKELKNVKEYVLKKSILDIEFTGFVKKNLKVDVYENADLYLFPTQYGEGMPISIIEAMAFGLPIITRPVGALVDFFENNKMGFITDSIKPEDFAKLTLKVMDDPILRRKIGEYNIKYATDNFSAPIIAERIDSIYLKTINHN